jgi:hypothetical protein
MKATDISQIEASVDKMKIQLPFLPSYYYYFHTNGYILFSFSQPKDWSE